MQPDLLDPTVATDPMGVWGRVREEGPVVKGRAMDGSPAWYVTRAEDVRFVLGDPRFVTSPDGILGAVDLRKALLESLGMSTEEGGPLTDSVFDRGGADHTRLRKLVSRAFTMRRVTDLRPRVQEITDRLLDAVDRGETVDLVDELAYPLPITVICELVGVPEADRPDWRRWSAVLCKMDPERVPDARQGMVENVRALIRARQAEPTGDLVTGLVQAQEEDGDRLADEEMVSLVLALVAAGHETTAHLIANSVIALLEHPDQLDRLRREPEGWPVAVNELMRMCSPVQITRMRYATEHVELAGVTIRAGEMVQPVLLAANTDPREYSNADNLDVARRAAHRGGGHVGFGHGIHHCLGSALVRQEMEILLSTLFTRFPDLALVGDPVRTSSPGMRLVGELPVCIR